MVGIVLVVAGLLSTGAQRGPAVPTLKAGDAARMGSERVPLGVDRAGYVAMIEALAQGDVPGLGRLIGSGRGFLAGRDTRVEVLAIEDGLVRVRTVAAWGQTRREGVLGPRWLEPLPKANQATVDPKIRALAELRRRQDARTRAEQQVLAEAFAAQMARGAARPGTIGSLAPAGAANPAVPAASEAAPGGVVAPLAKDTTATGTPTAVPPTAPAAPAPAAQAPPPSTPPSATANPAAAVPAVPPAASPAPVAPPAATPAPTEKKGHYCGATTKAGSACRRWVVNGVKCYQHGG